MKKVNLSGFEYMYVTRNTSALVGVMVNNLANQKRGENTMKNLTVLKAIEIGFSYEDSNFETREELEQEIMDFLNENIDKLEQREDECEVSSNGRNQHVSYGDYECSGEILQYGPKYWYSSPETKHFHSSFLLIEKDGIPVCMNLYQLTGENEYNTNKEEDNG